MRCLIVPSLLCCAAMLLLAGCSDTQTTTADNSATATGETPPALTDTTANGTEVTQHAADPLSSDTDVVASDPIETPEANPETVPAQPEADGVTYNEGQVEAETLGIGSPAPPLTLASWVMGDAVEGFQAGQVYVVEFWATWCGPCKTSMPHLSQLQQDYGEKVRMIGISDEPENVVTNFLDEEQSPGNTWRDTIQYAIATDEGRSTNAAYMEAAGQGGIPTAFVVGRDGVVEWIGHPMQMDEPLAQIVANEWDRDAAIAEFEAKQRMQLAMTAINAAARRGDWDEALKTVDRLLGQEGLADQMQAQLSGFKVQILQAAGRSDEALQLIDALVAESGPSLQMSMTKLSILQSEGRSEDVAALEAEIVDQNFDHARLLNQIAWSISERDEPRDLDLALRAAKRANELSEEGDASILDTLARVCYEQGNLEDAITWQKKAVAVGAEYPELAETLDAYEAELKSRDGASSEDPANADSREPLEAPREQ